MIYIAISNTYLGSVAISTAVIGVESDTFDNAVVILSNMEHMKDAHFDYTAKRLRFSIPQPKNSAYKVSGYMKSEPLEIFKA